MDTEEAHEGGCVGHNVHDSLLADITKMNLSIKMAKSMTFLTRQALAKMVTTMAMTRSYTRVRVVRYDLAVTRMRNLIRSESLRRI